MWTGFGDLTAERQRQAFNRPSILRFNRDTFMDELIALLRYFPDELGEWQAVPETWREPMREPHSAAKLSVPEPVSFFAARQKRGQEQGSTVVPEENPDSLADDGLLKLYQPAQQRFYLVSASLVCRKAGLPDRGIAREKQEQPSFVVRRLIPETRGAREALEDGQIEVHEGRVQGCRELALVQSSAGSRWREVGAGDLPPENQPAPGEERLPMFSIGFSDSGGFPRKLLAGLIPVSRREFYLAAKPFVGDERAGGDESGQTADKRRAIKTLFVQQVSAPWKSLLTQAHNDRAALASTSSSPPRSESAIEDDFGSPPGGADDALVLEAREQVQTTSWYILLDLLGLLERYLPELADCIQQGQFTDDDRQALPFKQRPLFDFLKAIAIGSGTGLHDDLDALLSGYPDTVEPDLIQALHWLASNVDVRSNLEEVQVTYRSGGDPDAPAEHALWPTHLFPLADILHPQDIALPDSLLGGEDTAGLAPYEVEHRKVDRFIERLVGAIAVDENTRAPDIHAPDEAPQLDGQNGWFMIRCVYETPNCGPFQPALLSAPTRPFEMASFFDSDAPGRPIRIPMPMDISPAGLRKYSRNATFMISDALCGKIKGMRKLTLGDLVLSVLPWPFHKDLPDVDQGPCKDSGGGFGMFCSLSIPIVTLCAMILLIIMVTLFNVFFRWLPLLFMCLPIPGLKGKR